MAFLRHVVAKLPSRRVISVACKFDLTHSCLHQLAESAAAHISPIEVDFVLLSHPGIAQAVAFGVPHAKYGEQIYCAVIPREGSNVDEAEVLRYSKKNVASFKVPKKVFITDSLPKTATGKILRRILAEHFVS
ncbi:Oxalate--CoA ligase, partial [Mucuna pruriens]